MTEIHCIFCNKFITKSKYFKLELSLINEYNQANKFDVLKCRLIYNDIKNHYIFCKQCKTFVIKVLPSSPRLELTRKHYNIEDFDLFDSDIPLEIIKNTYSIYQQNIYVLELKNTIHDNYRYMDYNIIELKQSIEDINLKYDEKLGDEKIRDEKIRDEKIRDEGKRDELRRDEITQCIQCIQCIQNELTDIKIQLKYQQEENKKNRLFLNIIIIFFIVILSKIN
jgi:hypothetical protein